MKRPIALLLLQLTGTSVVSQTRTLPHPSRTGDQTLSFLIYLLLKLFKLENQDTSLGPKNERGTGLGVKICKEFVELNGDKI
jgi:hypothetical protein